MKLAVIPGDGIGVEVTEQALRVLDAVHARRREHALRPRRGALAPHRRDAARLGAGRAARARRDPARRGRRPVRARRACSSAACCCGCASSSTTTSTCARPGCYPGVPTPAGRRPGDRLRGGPRGHRGPVRRQRRRAAQGHAARDRDRGQRQHRVRRRAGRPRRLRARAGPAAQAPDPGAQDQRADPRRRPVVPHRRAGGAGVPGRRRSPTSTSTPRRSTWSPTRAATT